MDLKKSLKVRPPLYPILEDAKGEIIDGYHRREVKEDWPVRKLEWVKTEKDRILTRIHANTQRRTVSVGERRRDFAALAAELEKEGVKPRKMSKYVSELTGVTERWARMLLPKKYRRAYTKSEPTSESPPPVIVPVEVKSEIVEEFGDPEKALPDLIEKGAEAKRREIEKAKAKPKPPEIAPEPEFTGEDWTCLICGEKFNLFHHPNPKMHKIEHVKGEK